MVVVTIIIIIIIIVVDDDRTLSVRMWRSVSSYPRDPALQMMIARYHEVGQGPGAVAVHVAAMIVGRGMGGEEEEGGAGAGAGAGIEGAPGIGVHHPGGSVSRMTS